jgi:hypothetical protein
VGANCGLHQTAPGGAVLAGLGEHLRALR